ncbi:MAG: DUF1841 family protein [bacterium]
MTDDSQGRFVIELQGIDKRHLALVWQKMKDGEELTGAEVFIGRSLADHPQWFPFFDTIGLLGGDDTLPDGENPFAHVSMHVLLGSQIFHASPKEAELFYRMRLRKGDDSHMVIHMMLEVFQRHLAWAVQHAGPDGQANLDMTAYARTLRTLWPLKTDKLWQRLGHARIPLLH